MHPTSADKRSQAILVLGCHRSGTSLLTRGMLAAGASLAEDLVAPAADNPTGFWEDAEVVALNREMLLASGNTWDSTRLHPVEQLENRQHWIERAAGLLRANYQDQELFALKDPAMCLLLPIWVAAFRQLGIELRVAIILRSPLAVADSLHARNQFSVEKSLMIWLAYNWSLVTSLELKDLALGVCDYDRLMDQPAATLKGLLDRLGLPCDEASLEEFAGEFVNPALKHSARGIEELADDPTAELARQLAEQLLPLAARQDSAALRDTLGSLRTHELGSLLAGHIDGFVSGDRSAMLEDLRTDLDESREALQQARGWQVEAERLEAELQSEEAAFQAELDRLNAALAEKEANYQGAIERLEGELKQTHSEYGEQLGRLETRLVEESRAQAEEHRQAMADVSSVYEAQVAEMHLEMARKDAGYEAQIDTVTREREQARVETAQLRASFSYRLGRLLTWPLRKPYALLVQPFVRNRAFRELMEEVRRNPWKTLKLINPRRIGNLFRIVYARPELSNQVFRYYEEQLSQERKYLDVGLQQNTDARALHFELVDRPRVSIIIPVYNQLDYTLACLASIQKHLPGTGFEIIVVDDCSSDDTETVISKIPGVYYRRNAENLRFLRSVNGAASAARGEFIYLLNNDTQLLPGAVDSLVGTFDEHPDAGVVGSRLLFPDGRLQEAGGIVWRDASAWNFGRLDDPDKPDYSYLKPADYVSGAALMVRRELWQALGGFDDRYAPAYYEDTDLCFAARQAGYQVLLQPRSNVVHFEGVSHGTDTSTGIKQHQLVNQQKFLEKWQQVLEAEHFPNGERVFQARDRAQLRRTVLVVDHYVPHFDRDAGSRSTFQYLKLLVNEGFNVKFLGDNFFKHEPYTSRLEELGIEVLHGNDYAQNWRRWLQDHADMLDVIYFHRPHITEKYLDTLAKMEPRPKSIYFGHDLHFLRLERQAAVENSAALLEEAEAWRARELKIFEAVDLVYYPSQVEVEQIKALRPDCPARAIPLYIFEQPWDIEYRADQRRDLLFIGGFNHPPNVDAILWFADLFNAAALDGAKLHIVGSNMPDTVAELASDHVIVHGFLEDEQVDELYRRVRLAVVPLRFGAGIKGKVLESMEKGVPVLTTEIGAEGIANADSSLCVAANDDFKAQLEALYSDADRLQALSNAGRDTIRDSYSVAAARDAVLADFQ